MKYFNFPTGVASSIENIDKLNSVKGVKYWKISLKNGDSIKKITSSLDRYGFAIFQSENRSLLFDSMDKTESLLHELVVITK